MATNAKVAAEQRELAWRGFTPGAGEAASTPEKAR